MATDPAVLDQSTEDKTTEEKENEMGETTLNETLPPLKGDGKEDADKVGGSTSNVATMKQTVEKAQEDTAPQLTEVGGEGPEKMGESSTDAVTKKQAKDSSQEGIINESRFVDEKVVQKTIPGDSVDTGPQAQVEFSKEPIREVFVGECPKVEEVSESPAHVLGEREAQVEGKSEETNQVFDIPESLDAADEQLNLKASKSLSEDEEIKEMTVPAPSKLVKPVENPKDPEGPKILAAEVKSNPELDESGVVDVSEAVLNSEENLANSDFAEATTVSSSGINEQPNLQVPKSLPEEEENKETLVSTEKPAENLMEVGPKADHVEAKTDAQLLESGSADVFEEENSENKRNSNLVMEAPEPGNVADDPFNVQALKPFSAEESNEVVVPPPLKPEKPQVDIQKPEQKAAAAEDKPELQLEESGTFEVYESLKKSDDSSVYSTTAIPSPEVANEQSIVDVPKSLSDEKSKEMTETSVLKNLRTAAEDAQVEESNGSILHTKAEAAAESNTSVCEKERHKQESNATDVPEEGTDKEVDQEGSLIGISQSLVKAANQVDKEGELISKIEETSSDVTAKIEEVAPTLQEVEKDDSAAEAAEALEEHDKVEELNEEKEKIVQSGLVQNTKINETETFDSAFSFAACASEAQKDSKDTQVGVNEDVKGADVTDTEEIGLGGNGKENPSGGIEVETVGNKAEEAEESEVQNPVENTMDVDPKVDAKQEVHTKPKQSYNLMSKMKHSYGKVKRSIFGKTPSSKTLTSESKDVANVK